jgi:predicted Rossmann fold flavoprotein
MDRQQMKNKTVAVIGGGAAGLIAAIFASEGAKVIVLERGARVGKKILATGNGRCNLSNRYADETHYHGENPKFVRSALGQFTVEDTVEFFMSLGVICTEEEQGKLYPYSGQAGSVLDVLRMEIARRKVEIRCGFEARSIQKKGNGFRIMPYEGEAVTADSVILACGGKASPNLGSNGSGYSLAEALGHSVTTLFPALVQMKTDTEYVKGLKGIKFDGTLTVNDTYKQSGEILFTEYGISGPPVFQLSRVISQNGGGKVTLDFMPEYSEEEILLFLKMRKTPQRSLEEYFTGMLHKRIGQTLLKACGITPLSRMSDSLSEREMKSLAKMIKAWTIQAKGTMSWNNAQVTAGGISTSEVSPSSMESKKAPGVYIVGELLDIDGDCGGYNLQWAWSSGAVAGKHAGGIV